MGSVKDLEVGIEATEGELGIGDFVFSDRYSVFDWGEMPDHIPNKGAAICMMAAWNFEKLKERVKLSHYIGIKNSSGYAVRVEELDGPSNVMNVSLSRVVEPEFRDGEFDYSYFTERRGELQNVVIPLEVIYRNGAPKGSSLFKSLDRMESEGDAEGIGKLLGKYGLVERPSPGELFPVTGYDFTTKFEPKDRRITDEEAFRISGLNEEQFLQLEMLRDAAVDVVRERTEEVGLVDFDGKHEYRLFNGIVEMADVFGTPDENRFMLDGTQVSKELLRQVYKSEQPQWVEDVERAKAEAEERGIADWKSLTQVRPAPLSEELTDLVGEMYAATAELYTGARLFGARDLDVVMDKLRPYYS